jgi:hypothetical protein
LYQHLASRQYLFLLGMWAPDFLICNQIVKVAVPLGEEVGTKILLESL